MPTEKRKFKVKNRNPYNYKNTGLPPFEDWSGCPEYSNDRLKQILNRYRGKFSPSPPKRGDPKSTNIVIWDIEVITKITRSVLYAIMIEKPLSKNNKYFGSVRRRRLSYWLSLIDGGYITKIQHGKYKQHDKPVDRKLEMKLSIGPSGATMTPVMREEVKLRPVRSDKSVFDILRGE